MRSLLYLLVVLGLAERVSGISENRLLRGQSHDLSLPEKTLCHIILVDNMLELFNGTMVSAETAACIPIVSFRETKNLFAIDLPQQIVDDNHDDLHAGQLFLSITHATVVNREELLLDKSKSEIKVIRDPRFKDRKVDSDTALTTGKKTMAVIRISS